MGDQVRNQRNQPALVQDTGFSRNYPVGEGLVPFRTLEEAITGAERIARDYATHSRGARALVEAWEKGEHDGHELNR